MARLVFLELQDQKETWGQLVRKEARGYKVLEAKQGKQEDLVNLERWDPPVKMVLMAKREVLVLQEVQGHRVSRAQEVNLD